MMVTMRYSLLHVCVATAMMVLCGTSLAWDPPHNGTNGIACGDCHSIHGAGPATPQGAAQTTLCASCHNPDGTASAKINIGNEIHGNPTTGPTLQCSVCHNLHNIMQSDATSHGGGVANNLSLIRNKISTAVVPDALPSLVFQTKLSPNNYAFDIGTEGSPANGVCQTCHTSNATNTALNDGSNWDHKGNRNCAACHSHANSFQGVQASDCLTCHSEVQNGRRIITGASGDFVGTSHHVSGGSPNVSDCNACHDGSAHELGDVVLVKADGGTSFTINADPATDQTAAEDVGKHCISCHNASGPATPFSTGQTRPIIDGAKWNASVHVAKRISCYGENPDFGCHTNGHGGNKVNMLVATSDDTSPDNGGVEERICYNCHKAGGAAPNADIASLFLLDTRHPVDDDDQPAGGRGTECTTCHGDEHFVTAARAASANGNLIGGAIANAAKGVQADGTTLTTNLQYEYELCFLCHANYNPGGGAGPGDGGVASNGNKAALFATSNATFHPVVGAQNNTFCNSTTMYAPWNQGANEHNTMWCTDCHRTSSTLSGPHGGTGTILRAGLAAAEDGDGKWYTPLCVECHQRGSYVTGSTGSNFGHSQNQHYQADWTGGYGGCLSCHFDTKGRTGFTDYRRMASVHGGNVGDYGDNFAAATPEIPEAAFVNGSRIVTIARTGGGNPPSPQCTPVDAASGCSNNHTRSF